MELLMTILVLVAIAWMVECRVDVSAPIRKRYRRWLDRRRNGVALKSVESFDGAYTLVVVDMQPMFSASSDPATLRAVEAEVQRAVAGGFPVVILEYALCGNTYPSLLQFLDGYPKLVIKIKHDDCGSREVTEACREHNWGMQVFRICGVNTDCCVHDTVEGLVFAVPGTIVEVVREACNSERPKDRAWGDYCSLPASAVRIVSQSGAQVAPCAA